MSKRITLGLLVDQLVSGYARLLIAGVEDWCRGHDANLIVFVGRVLQSPHGHEYQSNVIFEYIRPGTVDGLVMASGTQYSYLSRLQLQAYVSRFEGIPRVSIGIPLEGVPGVLIDNRSGILQAVEHLASAHRLRRIAFLVGPDTNEEAVLRRDAYREAVRKLGLADDDSLLIPGGDFTAAGARAALKARLDRDARPGFQGLLAANDEMAIAASQFLTERGHAVPRDVAVIGFDNIATAQVAVPPLTTVDQSLKAQGWQAADLAGRQARGEQVSPTVVLPVSLTVRTSCGCMPDDVVRLASLPVLPGRRGPIDAAAAARRCADALPAASRPGPAEQKALAALAAQYGTEAFLPTLHDALVSRMAGSEDLAPWPSLLSCLQRELIAAAHTPQEVAALALRFQEAGMLLSELERAREGRELTELRRHLRELRGVMEGLISVASADELMDDLTPQLARIDMRTCLIAVYSADVTHHRGESWVVPDHAELMLAVIDGTRLRGAEGFFSPARSLLPPSVPSRDRPSTRVATSMYFREEQIGYVVFEPGGCDPAIYETFCILLANVLKGSRLLAARKDAEERLRQVLAELEEYNQRLSGLSQTDELTGLYNRRAFISLGAQNLALARRMGRTGTVVFADVDYLKTINDSFGHEEGDVALGQAARILVTVFRNSDLVARLGGDEFSALAVGTAVDFPRTVRRRLDEALSEYNRQSGKSYQLSISIGSVAFKSSPGMGLEELLHRADEALYEEKRRKGRT